MILAADTGLAVNQVKKSNVEGPNPRDSLEKLEDESSDRHQAASELEQQLEEAEAKTARSPQEKAKGAVRLFDHLPEEETSQVCVRKKGSEKLMHPFYYHPGYSKMLPGCFPYIRHIQQDASIVSKNKPTAKVLHSSDTGC